LHPAPAHSLHRINSRHPAPAWVREDFEAVASGQLPVASKTKTKFQGFAGFKISKRFSVLHLQL
jgi:hypothetical protein